MSAVRSDRLESLAAAIDELSQAYLGDMEKFRQHMDQILPDVQWFSTFMVDLYDLADRLLLVESDPHICTVLEKVKSALEAVVIEACHGADIQAAHGLAIYLPDLSQGKYDPRYGDDLLGLDFCQDTHWDELLAAFCGPDHTMQPPFPPVHRFPSYQADGWLPPIHCKLQNNHCKM
jgi:hypothetical protein